VRVWTTMINGLTGWVRITVSHHTQLTESSCARSSSFICSQRPRVSCRTCCFRPRIHGRSSARARPSVNFHL